ncbi:unnamed protein product [Adineta steineri]|uniref:AAA+ ATPase domain-containing protein n=1 Tax=Adineta steineri TaxID=433720 RepID=A0A813WJ33_9BILA|nr:unnamed protein product [Adineta steineri]CAF3965063.1 unnamed protein product [Adineta steineri]
MPYKFDDTSYNDWKPNQSNPLNLLTTVSNESSSISPDIPPEVKEIERPIDINGIILKLKVKYDYPEIHKFIEDLRDPKGFLIVNGQRQSILQLYTLRILNDPIDMSNQTDRKVYRPTLFIRKNDAFSPFNHYFLLNLFDIEYEYINNNDFPKLWKTTMNTNVIIPPPTSTIESNVNITTHDTTTLKGVLYAICRENKYDKNDAEQWFKCLKEENINTIDHLRSITKDDWDKLNKINHVVKQLIRDYMEINNVVASFNQKKDPYKESKATLLGDIHRIRRYFYYVIDKLDLTSCLSPDAVDLAIKEVRKVYDDDGNILVNIENYLRTFCFENKIADKSLYEQKIKQWEKEIEQLKTKQMSLDREINQCYEESKRLKKDLEFQETRTNRILQKEKLISGDIAKLMMMNATEKINTGWFKRNEDALRKKQDYEKEKNKEIKALENAQEKHKQKNELYVNLVTKADSIKKQIKSLQELIQLNLEEQYKKLTVKCGRGLLLYGPPGTGKSELLKRVAVYAGITMITQPLSAGELNRPYVGETEKLLVDIMSRANTIPFLICAMTIDEIDGLAPKRDSNAQQGKVDGISVLLSHIEGVKNIPNLIVFGATNRRNMMDEAFLRRMQAKVFVGRPSPAIRKNMFIPLFCKDSNVFTTERIDSLVKITTNFSGAAIGALKSNLIIEMDRNPNITDHRLLELANSVAREFNIWFGISTLPEICRLNPTIINCEQDKEKYSLAFQKLIPTGRILIDYTDRKCFMEIQNEATLEKDLNSSETSIPRLLARFIHGCSTRNIDTIQIIDLNFSIKQNAFDENQIFELLTTTFLECNEYNRSMLIFDIDSLIMLDKSDSDMSQSKSISNIRVYQFIREKCKMSIVETTEPNEKGVSTAIEQWIVMIVKDPWLKDTLIDDIEFKKSTAQLNKEREVEEKRIDEETPRKCPKCLRNYTPNEVRDGSCYYHPGFVVNIDLPDEKMTGEQAQAILQRSILQKLPEQDKPELVWACCLRKYGDSLQPCETGKCGLPIELEDTVRMDSDDYITVVQEHFKRNITANKKLAFLKSIKRPTLATSVKPSMSTTTTTMIQTNDKSTMPSRKISQGK